MSRKLLLLGVSVSILGSTGCMTPRSMILGQTANVVGAGNAEVALSMGGSFARIGTQTGSTTISSTTHLFTVPEIEANAAFGMGESLDLNFHLSTAGIQPGVKIVLMRGDWNVAVMPEFAFLYSGNDANQQSTSRSIMLGAKLLASSPGGLYTGLGYDMRLLDRGSGNSAQTSLAHFGNVALGYEMKMGGVSLRPEIAFAIAPTFILADDPPDGFGTEMIILPNITIAVGGNTKVPKKKAQE